MSDLEKLRIGIHCELGKYYPTKKGFDMGKAMTERIKRELEELKLCRQY